MASYNNFSFFEHTEMDNRTVSDDQLARVAGRSSAVPSSSLSNVSQAAGDLYYYSNLNPTQSLSFSAPAFGQAGDYYGRTCGLSSQPTIPQRSSSPPTLDFTGAKPVLLFDVRAQNCAAAHTSPTPDPDAPPLGTPPPARAARPSGELVPQRPYLPRGKETFEARSVKFQSTNPWGSFLIRDALDNKYEDLCGKYDAMEEIQTGTAISARFEWLGYAPHSHPIKTTRWDVTRQPITRAKLANKIAKSLNEFILKKAERNPEPYTADELRWAVGPPGSEHISVDNLALVSLERVSKGSWQPVFLVI